MILQIVCVHFLNIINNNSTSKTNLSHFPFHNLWTTFKYTSIIFFFQYASILNIVTYVNNCEFVYNLWFLCFRDVTVHVLVSVQTSRFGSYSQTMNTVGHRRYTLQSRSVVMQQCLLTATTGKRAEEEETIYAPTYNNAASQFAYLYSALKVCTLLVKKK